MEKSTEIKEQVEEILKFCFLSENTKLRRTNMDEYKQICMRKFTNFHQNYPTLFFLIIENPTTFPKYRLDEYINIKKNIEENNLDYDKASVYIGNKYYNEFVKETVSELDKKIKK